MKKICSLLIFLMIFSFSAISLAKDYTLGAGDVLSLSVWGYDELEAKELAIRPDGKFALPLVGEVKAEGLTPSELTALITASLGEYVKNPQVTLNVMKFRTTRVYVLGEVKKPGLYELTKDHTLLDAIGMAEGYTKDAAKKKVMILHKNQTEKKATKANLLDVLTKADMTQNYTLNEGDVVYLTSSGKIDLASDILPFITAYKYINDIND